MLKKWLILRFFLDRVFPARRTQEVERKRPAEEVLPSLPEKALEVKDVCIVPPRESGQKFRPRKRNGIFKYKNHIRTAMRELRDEGVVIDYQEEFKPNSLVYKVFIRLGKRPLSLHFLVPRLGQERKRGVEAFSEQIFIRSYPTVGFLKTIIRRRIEARIKGWANEDRVFRLANELVQERADQYHFKMISVRKALSEEDRQGQIDLVFEVNYRGSTVAIPLQCKSSINGRDEHRRKNQRVPVIMIGEGRSDPKIKSRLVKIMSCFLAGEVIQA